MVGGKVRLESTQDGNYMSFAGIRVLCEQGKTPKQTTTASCDLDCYDVDELVKDLAPHVDSKILDMVERRVRGIVEKRESTCSGRQMTCKNPLIGKDKDTKKSKDDKSFFTSNKELMSMLQNWHKHQHDKDGGHH